MNKSFTIAYSCVLLGLAGCVEPYVPAVLDAPTSLLVVDGFINGNGRTRIKLARTANLAATALPAENGAKLFVVDNTGVRYALTEKTTGNYQSDSLLLPTNRQYQLRIITAGNTTYESALVPLKSTPPIDKLTWQLTGDQVQISVSTHDPAQQARYYRWSINETWEFNSAFKSTLQYDRKRDTIVYRPTLVYTCWRNILTSSIKQASTAQLSQDVLTDIPLLTISDRAERLSVRYSVLVGQYAETAEEFAYYDLLRKNTEAVGTVNDPLPTQLTGNVRRVDNASEPVLGFVSAHTVQHQRLFIDRAEIPRSRYWVFDTPYNNCQLLFGIPYDLFSDPSTTPVAFEKGSPFVYTGGTRECVDCTLRGTNVKPSFW
jgi:hypothetical protein